MSSALARSVPSSNDEPKSTARTTPTLADLAADGAIEPDEQLVVLVVGGPPRLVETMQPLLAARGGYAIGLVTVEHSPDALTRLAGGGFSAAIIFDDLTGHAVLQGVREQSIDVPLACIVELREGRERAAQRTALRREGALSCVFADELNGQVLEMAIVQAVESFRLVRSVIGLTAMNSSEYSTLLPQDVFMRRLAAAVVRAQAEPTYRYSVMLIDTTRLDASSQLTPSQLADVRAAMVTRVEVAAKGCVLGSTDDSSLAVLIEDVHDADDLDVMDLVREAVQQQYVVGDDPVYLEIGLGVARGRKPDVTPAAALRRARESTVFPESPTLDIASMSGIGSVSDVKALVELEDSLRAALARGEFSLTYQPIVELEQANLLGFEALIRWNHPDGGERRAAEFIAAAEETDLIVPIGYWAVEAAIKQMTEWEDEFELDGKMLVSINLSAGQVVDPLFVERVRSLLMTTGLTPQCLRFEVQASVLVEYAQDVSTLVHGLADLGARVWIENYGLGECSVDHLRGLPIDGLKIDRSFVSRLDGTDMTSGRVRHVVDAARALRVRVIGQGVENALQANVLRWLGCAVGQGYMYAAPMPVGEVYAYLAGKLNQQG